MSSKKINRDWVLPNLYETIEHIQSAIDGIESGDDGMLDAYIISIYRDLNRAWNGRHTKDIRKSASLESLCAFPTDLNVAD